MFNGDIEVSVCKPTEAAGGLPPQRRGRRGRLRPPRRRRRCGRCSGRSPTASRTTSSSRAARRTAGEPDAGVEQFWICFHTPGEIETPNRYRNRYGQLLEHAPVLAARLPRPGRARDHRGGRRVRADAARPRRLPELRARPPPVRRRRLGRLRLPVHVQRDGLRAARRALPPAPAGPPDLPGPELRHLHVRARGCSTGTRRRCRSPTTTRTSSPRRSCSTRTATTPRARAWRSAA